MDEKRQEFSIENLVPSEEVSSGMHQPSGENLWAVPNKADDGGSMSNDLVSTIMSNPPSVASFDFDDTLSFQIYRVPEDWDLFNITGRRMSPIIKDIVNKLHSAGTTLHMVTSRRDTPENRKEVEAFLKANDILNLFSEFHFVGDEKAHKLQEIGSELHFDDDDYEFEYLNQAYPESKTQFVQIQHTETPGELHGLLPDSWKMEKLNALISVLRKNGIGLNSVPQSLYGGEVLELPGSPQPPGLSRETGDDEETDFFGAKEDDADFSPEHYKEHKKTQESDDEPAEEFFDFLFTNNHKKNEKVSFYYGGSKMNSLLKNLELGLKKIGEKKAASFVNKMAQKQSLELSELIKKINDISSYFIGSGYGIYSGEEEYKAQGRENFGAFIAELRQRIFSGVKSSRQVLNIENLYDDVIKLAQKHDVISNYVEQGTAHANFRRLVNELVVAAKSYNQSEEVREGLQPEEEEKSVTGPIAKREEVPEAQEATGWDKYVSMTGDLGKRVRDSWVSFVESNPEFGNASYSSWLKWYYDAKGEGPHLTPEQVLSKLQVSAPEAAEPAEVPEEVPEVAPAKEAPEAEERPIAEEPEVVSAAQEMEELFETIMNRTAVVSGPFRVKNLRVRRKIDRLGGPKAAAEAVLSRRGDGDLEEGLAYYDRLSQEGAQRGEKRRRHKTISYEDMSQFENQAIADLLAIESPRERRRAMDERFDGILKFSE